jgi:hypothetical protein
VKVTIARSRDEGVDDAPLNLTSASGVAFRS